ncbi:MAG: hypothetical protein HY287_05205 [Planctomycetes bacterium]|nr:hypothetical protein [Planctomycetota bacterium]MBI3833710.1 hypothetical protein [Planctomycetota bacterium]
MTDEKCPVCNSEMNQPKSVNVEGKTINVCCDECATEAKRNPSKFASGSFGISGSTYSSSAGSKVGASADSGAGFGSKPSSPKTR